MVVVGEREEKYLTESYTKRGHSEFLTFFAHNRFKKKRETARGMERQGRATPRQVFVYFAAFSPALLFRETEASARPRLTHPCIQGLAAGP